MADPDCWPGAQSPVVFGIDRTPNGDGMVNRDEGGRRAAAVDAVRDAAVAVGLAVTVIEPDGDGAADLVLANPAGGQVCVSIKWLSLASADGLGRRIAVWGRQLTDTSTEGLVVADRVTQEARGLLSAAGWGWLDLRGHFHVVAPGLFVDADIPRMPRPTGGSLPLAGRVGVGVAAALLLHPDEPGAVRPIAGLLGRAPSSVSEALTGMQRANLIDRDRRPVLPDLFWALVERWRPSQTNIRVGPSAVPDAVNALKLGLDNVTTTIGWALTDSLAAAAYGAPIGVRSDHPPDFYVPDESVLRRATRLLGTAPDHQNRAATVRVAPVPMICADRVDPGRTQDGWPLAQPLFVALDLAQDPGRGRDVLAGWTPPKDLGRRVW